MRKLLCVLCSAVVSLCVSLVRFALWMGSQFSRRSMFPFSRLRRAAGKKKNAGNGPLSKRFFLRRVQIFSWGQGCQPLEGSRVCCKDDGKSKISTHAAVTDVPIPVAMQTVQA